MSFIIGNSFTASKLLNSAFTFANLYFGLKQDSQFRFCQDESRAYLFKQHISTEYDCSKLLIDWRTLDPMTICSLNSHGIATLVIIDSNVDITISQCSGINDSKWFFGLDHESLSFFISDDVFPGHNVTQDTFFLSTQSNGFASTIHLDSNLFLQLEGMPYIDQQQWELEVCQLLTSSLEAKSQSYLPFVVISESPSMRFTTQWKGKGYPWSTSYWLDFCGLNPITVHTWELSETFGNSEGNDGICDVKYVTNVNNSSIDRMRSVACLSDVMDEKYEVLSQQSVDQSARGNRIEFFSSLGMSALTVSTNGHCEDAVLLQSIVQLREMVAIIRAHQMLEELSDQSTILHVKSLIGSKNSVNNFELTEYSIDHTTFSTLLFDILTMSNVDSDADIQWANKIAKLSDWISNDLKHILTFQIREVLTVLLLDSTDFIESCHKVSSNYFCGSDATINELWQILSSLEKSQAFVDSVFSSLLINKPKSDIWEPKNIQRPLIQPLVDGNAFVLIYVLGDQLEIADATVERLQAGAFHELEAERGCDMFIHYVVIPISIEEEDSMLRENYFRRPSMRAVIDHATHYINDVLTVQDVVFVLNGLSALNSYPQPTSYAIASEDGREFLLPYEGIIPNVLYGISYITRLSANVMVSCGHCDYVTWRLTDFNFNAFVGVGHRVLAMLKSVRSHPLYSYSNDEKIHELLREYARDNPMEVALDYQNVAFKWDRFHRNLRFSNLTQVVTYDDLFDSDLLNNHILYNEFSLHSELPVDLIQLDKETGNCLIDEIAADIAISSIFYDLFQSHQWFAGSFYLLQLIERTKYCDNFSLFADDIAHRFLLLAKFSAHFNYFISHEEYRLTAKLLQFYTENILQSDLLSDNSVHSSLHSNVDGDSNDYFAKSFTSDISKIIMATSTAQSSLYRETGSYDLATNAFRRTLNPVTYSVVHYRRLKWSEHRKLFSPSTLLDSPIKTHFVTYANKMTSGLENLLLSAKMSQIDLKIIGMGTMYHDFGDKVDAYYNYLLSDISENDIVVMVDAFDVLLFPKARNIGKFMSESKYSIVFCADAVYHFELAATSFYHRGVTVDKSNRTNHNHMTQKYLNSGCIAGRVGQLRHMLASAHKYSAVFRDDQQYYTHYLLENPDMVGVDYEHNMFLTTFKMSSVVQLAVTDELLLDYRSKPLAGAQKEAHTRIGIVHCNSAVNNNIYATLSAKVRSLFERYYSGDDGDLLLKAVNLIHDSEYSLALDLLMNPIVMRNMTSQGGGVNDIGDKLIDIIQTNI